MVTMYWAPTPKIVVTQAIAAMRTIHMIAVVVVHVVALIIVVVSLLVIRQVLYISARSIRAAGGMIAVKARRRLLVHCFCTHIPIGFNMSECIRSEAFVIKNTLLLLLLSLV